MQELPFITSNPAVDEFNRANKAADEGRTADLQQAQLKVATEKGAFDLETARNEAPTRLRTLTAQGNLATTQAQTAQAVAPYAAPTAQAGLDQMKVHLEKERAEIGAMSRAQASWRVDQETKVYQALDANNPDLASSIAASIGKPLPDQVIQDANLRNTLKQIHQEALTRYPDNPGMALQWETGIAQGLLERRQQNQPIDPQTSLYTTPVPGAPQPPTTAKPLNVPAGGTVIDPATGQPIFHNSDPGRQNFDVVNRQEPDEAGKPVVRSYRFNRSTGEMTPIEGTGGIGKSIPKPAGGLDPQAMDGIADRLLMGDKTAIPPGLSRNFEAATALQNHIYQRAQEKGVSPQQLSLAMAGFNGTLAAQRTIGQTGARIEYAGNTANSAIDLAREAYSKLPRDQFVPFNQLRQMVDTKTSSPQQAAAYTAVNTLVQEYARVASPVGQPTEATREHAREMLNTAMGHEAFYAVLDMMKREIANAKAAYDQTRQQFLTNASGEPGGALPPPAGSAASTKPATVQQNGHTYQLQPDGSYQ